MDSNEWSMRVKEAALLLNVSPTTIVSGTRLRTALVAPAMGVVVPPLVCSH